LSKYTRLVKKISRRSEQQFLREVAYKETERRKKKHRAKHNLLGGGSNEAVKSATKQNKTEMI